jgi:hypothetical protein
MIASMMSAAKMISATRVLADFADIPAHHDKSSTAVIKNAHADAHQQALRITTQFMLCAPSVKQCNQC